MKKLKAFSFSFLALSMTLAISASAAQSTAITDIVVDYPVAGSETSKEVYLDPVKVNETTYNYYDENGELEAVLYLDSSNESISSAASQVIARGTKYTVDWDIMGNSYMHGSVDLDTTQGATEVYYKILFVHSGRSYVGNYMSVSDTYHWYNPPSSNGLSGVYLAATSHKSNFALKNDTNTANTYIGGYSLSPLS